MCIPYVTSLFITGLLDKAKGYYCIVFFSTLPFINVPVWMCADVRGRDNSW